MASATSSFRISTDLQKRLSEAALRLKKRKNAIINEALEVYLSKANRDAELAEARRQSILVSEHDAKNKVRREEDRFWENTTDTRGWR